jgi:sterol desaturase/sphingolipid hydroxylase (fatty acid hydroxylase superfamily)
MDWLVLDLLGSTTVFVILEKLFPLYKNQPIFRKEWQTDLIHFGVNHLLVGLMLLIVNFFIHRAQEGGCAEPCRASRLKERLTSG